MERRYPWAPLVDAMGVAESRAARTFGLGGSAMVRYRERGIPFTVADRLANVAGFHPAEIWPSWVEDAEQDRRAAHAAAMRRRRRTAKGRAENVAAVRRYRANLTPAARRAIRAKDLAYKRANRETINARQRERDRARRDERNAARRERYRTDQEYRDRILAAQRAPDEAKRPRRDRVEFIVDKTDHKSPLTSNSAHSLTPQQPVETPQPRESVAA